MATDASPGGPGDVPGGVDALSGGPEVPIDADPASSVSLEANLGQPEPLDVAGATDRVEHELRAQSLSVHTHYQAVGVALDRLDLRFEHQPGSRPR